MSPDEWDELFAAQGEKCAVCRALEPRDSRWVIDHDHASGAVRGIVCNGCNLGIGHFGDDLNNLHRAVAYLELADIEEWT